MNMSHRTQVRCTPADTTAIPPWHWARHLFYRKRNCPGRVRFLFQPCEETTDEEGKSGAQRMAAEGAMDGVDYVIAQHVDPLKPVGTIGINAGPNSGGVDSWYASDHRQRRAWSASR